MADDEGEQGASNEEMLLGASKRNQSELLDEALADLSKVNVNCQDGLGNTPLHYAALFGHLETAQRLLQAGAKPSVQNRQWDTPLHGAVERDHVDIIRLLIEHNAHITLKNKQKQTPLNLAQSTEVKEILQAAMFAKQIDAEVASDDDDDEADGDDE